MTRAGVAGLVAAAVLFVGRATPHAGDPPVDDEQQIVKSSARRNIARGRPLTVPKDAPVVVIS